MTHPDTVTLAGLGQLSAQALTLGTEAFAQAMWDWLRSQIRHDRAALVTSGPAEPGYFDAHFLGFPDTAATLASWESVAHLDDVTPRLLSPPLQARRQDRRMPDLFDEKYRPLREHLERHGIEHVIAIAVPVVGEPRVMMFFLIRSTPEDRYADAELQQLESLAPLACNLFTIQRAAMLWRAPMRSAEPAVAIANAQGQLLQTSSAFMRAMWPDAPPQTNYLPPDCWQALRAGRFWPLPDGRHQLSALAIEADNWLLRVSTGSRAALLSRRERDIALRFAEGASYTRIADETGLAPATVRNHLRNVYLKLEVSHRAGLIAALDGLRQT
ncbi:helix-turn-helix transcriptional regulator [Viridibacterium curvum]